MAIVYVEKTKFANGCVECIKEKKLIEAGTSCFWDSSSSGKNRNWHVDCYKAKYPDGFARVMKQREERNSAPKQNEGEFIAYIEAVALDSFQIVEKLIKEKPERANYAQGMAAELAKAQFGMRTAKFIATKYNTK